MRRLSTLPIALAMIAVLAIAGCKNVVIQPPGYAAGFYANPGARDLP